MIGNTGGGEDGTVEGVVAFTEGDDGGTARSGGVVGASEGGLGAVGGCVDLVSE